MEPILGSSVCLVCFEMTEKHIFVPSGAPEKLFINCNKYLHSTLTKGTLKDIELHNENQVLLCKKCFDSALELTQLSEQLTTIQKDISDLAVAFSIAVFHRRSQVYSIGQSCPTSSIVEFNEACLPPNLFSIKLGDQNIQPNKNNQEMDTDGLHPHQTDITNMKSEGNDIQFDNLSGDPQQMVVNDDIEIKFNKEHVDKPCGESTIEQNQNLECVSEMKIVHVTGRNCRNDSKKCPDSNNGVKLTMSDLLTSVKMPKIILERIKIVDHKLDVSVGNSNQTKCPSGQKNLDEILLKNDEFSVHSFAPESPGDGNLLKCLYCEKTFSQESHRTLHLKTHTGDKNKRPHGKQKFVYRGNQKKCRMTLKGKKAFYKCSYCEKGCSTPSILQAHERTHTGEKPFKCSFCSTRFSQSSTLKSHERTHTGEKRFKCSFCNKLFNHKNSIKLHERTHTGEQPFKCSYCNSRFNQRISLKRHEMVHTGEKPFKCSFCNNRFNNQTSRKYHETKHTGERRLQCSFCNKRFNLPIDVKRHERTHTGEKPFKCSFCGQGFSLKYNMQVHEKIHTGEKPYKCLYCEKTFSVPGVKNAHQKCHTEQMSSLVSQLGNEKDASLGHQDQMLSAGHMEFKCSFCEITFSHEEERANHENIHRREDEIVNENFIVGI